MKKKDNIIKSYPLTKITKNLYAIRVFTPKYIGEHTITFINMAKMGDADYAEIFIKLVDKSKK